MVATLVTELEAVRTEDRALDGSYASIDHVEDLLTQDPERWRRLAPVYLGQLLVEHAGASWIAGGVLSGFREAPAHRWSPEVAVNAFAQKPSPGHLRAVTEHNDLALRRAQVAELERETPQRLAELRRDVHELTGADPGPLEGELASIDAIEEGLKRARAASREVRRRVQTATMLYLGEVLFHGAGQREPWTVCAEPDNADFGEARIGRWSPIVVVRNTGPKSPPGVLRRAVEQMIKARRNS